MGFRNTKQSLQDIAEIKEAEQKERERQQKNAEEFEQLKNDVKQAIIKTLNETESGSKNQLLFYYNNKVELATDVYKRLLKNHLVIIKNKEADRHPKLKPPLDAYFIDDSGALTPIYKQISKYNEDDYNKENLLVLIDELLREQLGAEQKEAAAIEKLEAEEQKKDFENIKNTILQFMILLYKEQKEKYNYNAFTIYDVLLLENAREQYLKNLKLDCNSENLKAYNEAAKEFKNIYCIGTRPKEAKKKKEGLGMIGGAIAIFLGITEGMTKK